VDLKILEEKIDSLIEEMKKSRQQRKRDRIFSKIDGLFYVLITLSTFISGIIITQSHFLIETSVLLPLIGVLLSMLISFAIGFKGMISYSIENRIYAWYFLLVSLAWYAIFPMNWISIAIFGEQSIWYLVSGGVSGLLVGFFQVAIAEKLVNWAETKLTSLLREQVSVWSKIKDRINRTIMSVVGVFVVLVFLSEVFQQLIK